MRGNAPVPSDAPLNAWHWAQPGAPAAVPCAAITAPRLGSATCVAFELCGRGPEPESEYSWTKPYTVTRFVAYRQDAQVLYQQLLAYYPNSAVVLDKDADDLGFNLGNDEGSFGTTLALDGPYCLPIRTVSRLEPDPLGPKRADPPNPEPGVVH